MLSTPPELAHARLSAEQEPTVAVHVWGRFALL